MWEYDVEIQTTQMGVFLTERGKSHVKGHFFRTLSDDEFDWLIFLVSTDRIFSFYCSKRQSA